MTRARFPGVPRRFLGLAAMAASALLLSADGDSQTHSNIHPYLQIEQVLTADFNTGDVLTYTGVGGGVTATIATRRGPGGVAPPFQRPPPPEPHINEQGSPT